MKIYKTAAGLPPPGHVRIRFTVKPGGIVEKKIIAHGPDVGCQGSGKSIEVSSELLSDLLNIEVEGFGSPEEVRINGGKTEQGRSALIGIGKGHPVEMGLPDEPSHVVEEPPKEVDMGTNS